MQATETSGVNTSCISIVSQMKQMLDDKANKYDYEVKADMPSPTEYSEKVFLGALSHTTTKTKKRVIFKPTAIWDLHRVPATPPETARMYLDITHQRRLRVSSEQYDSIMQKRNAPLYFIPTQTERGVYVDIRSAYLQIMDIVGWDVDYHPYKFLAAGRPPLDFPLRSHKVARNSLVTAGLSSPVTVWTGYKLVESYPQNKHINYGLYALIHDLLHEVANLAYRYGAFYINTDGYIMDDTVAESFMHDVKRWVGLDCAVKDYGETRVTGVGSYMCGEHTTGSFHWDFDRPFSNLYKPHDEMLVKTVKSIATNRVDKPHYTVLDLR